MECSLVHDLVGNVMKSYGDFMLMEVFEHINHELFKSILNLICNLPYFVSRRSLAPSVSCSRCMVSLR